MKAKPNLTLARLVVESYIDSADSSMDLVYFTKEAHEKLSAIYQTGLFDDSVEDAIETHKMVDTHLFYALQSKLNINLK